jgi:hypothetical protein
VRHSMRLLATSSGSVVEVEGVVEIVRRLEQVGQTCDGVRWFCMRNFGV